MNELAKHYGLLLGLDESWRVVDVELSLEDKRVRIRLEPTQGRTEICPECETARPLKDHAPERQWRHLDTMQFETILVARLPRTNCPDCGVKTVSAPWAAPHGRFTLLFEAFAIEVLQSASSVEAARRLLGLSWSSTQAIMDRAVQRGLRRRSLDEVRYVGMDEKSFRKGQDYVSVMTDIDGGRVLDVAQGRDEAAGSRLWRTLSKEQRDQVLAVAMDMSQAYENAARACAPWADVVHDRFHVSKHLNEAVDKVRRAENKALMADDDHTLTGSRRLWLYNPENLSDAAWAEFEPLKRAELKTARAWAIREQFRWFWEYSRAGWAKKFFDQWYTWASRCRLDPVVDAAKMLKRRLGNLLTWFRHRISNGPAEGFNSRIQALKSSARGFRDFLNYRTRILFFCGKLQMLPTKM